MTIPRQVLAGSTYLVTRRCSERRYFLRPTERSNRTFLFILAVAAEKHGIQVHAYCVLSNHYHLVVTDPQAQLPDFQRYLDGLVARATNASLGRWESFWDPDSYSAVRLEDAPTILDKIVYVLTNPVAAGLVRRGSDWPGLWSDPGAIGRGAVEVRRPLEFFRRDGPMPALARLDLVRPPGFESDIGFTDRLRNRAREEEDAAAERLRRAGRRFLSPARVVAQDPFACPGTIERRRRLDPRVASRDPEARMGAIQRLRAFVWAYREALESWVQGLRDIRFPQGTWLMRVRHAAPCHGGGS